MNTITMPQNVRTMTFQLTAETIIVFANDYDSVAVRSDKEIGISEFSGKQIGDNGVLKCKENESVIYPNLIRKKYIYIVGTSGANVEIFVGNGLVVNPFKKTQKGGDDSDKLPQYVSGYSGFTNFNRTNSDDMYMRMNNLPFITNTGKDLTLEFCMYLNSGRTHAGRYFDFDNGTFVVADEYSDGHYYLEIKFNGEWRITESLQFELPQDTFFTLTIEIVAEHILIVMQKENGDSSFILNVTVNNTMLANLTSGNAYFFDSAESNRHVDGRIFAFRRYPRALTQAEITKNHQEDMRLVAMANRLEIIKQPEDLSAAAGERIYLYVEAIGEGLTYQWQYKYPESYMPGAQWSNYLEQTSPTLSRVVRDYWDGIKMRCIVADDTHNSIISREATITVTENRSGAETKYIPEEYEDYSDLKSDNDEYTKVKEIDDLWK